MLFSKKQTTSSSSVNGQPYRYSYVYSSRQTKSVPPPATQVHRYHRKRRWLVSLMAVALLAGTIISGVNMVHARELSDSQSGKSALAKSSQPVLLAADVKDPALATSINNIIAQYPDDEIGVSLVSVANGKAALYGISDPYIAGSVTKLMTAALFLHQVQIGQASLTQPMEDGRTAQTDLQQMITISDNDAWISLNDFLTHPALKTYATGLGINSYDPDANTIAPEDVAQLLYKLYDHQLLDTANTNLLLSYMKQADYTQYIMAAIPSGVTAYHKVGYLDDRVNDAAIIDNGQTAYVLVIFSKAIDGNYDFTAGEQLFHDITTATTTALLKT